MGRPSADVMAAARRAWPELAVAEAELARYLAARDGDHVDLILACAIASGDRAALDAFERAIVPAIEPAVRRLAPDGDFVGEVHQRLREHLVVGRRITDYQGRGPLVAWVRIVAVRMALDVIRRARVDTRRRAAAANEPLVAYLDLERELIHARYGAELRAAFEAALAELPVSDKHLLQLHVIEGVSLSHIGGLHGVNKSTVSRWLAAAREALERGVRRRLAARLQLDEREIDSLVGMLRSRLELSVERLLGDGA